ncbi:Luciferase-like monooxygenase [Streptomyces sp. Ag109_G2-15]|nr:Luciferase-like monooxygenase [Streptomyces sp. Ag109_G2-15]
MTRRIVLGTAAVVLPLRKPLLVAKAAATVDHLSGSRFVLGLAGGDRPIEYPLFGEDFGKRAATFRDDLAILRQAWAAPPAGSGITVPALGLKAERRLDVLPKPAGAVCRWSSLGARGRISTGSAPTSTAGSTTRAAWRPRPRHLDGRRARTHALGTPKPYLTLMFVLVGTGNFWLAVLGMALATFPHAMYYAALAGILARDYPVEVRYTRMSLSYQACTALFAGTAPIVSQYLLTATGSIWSVVALGLGYVVITVAGVRGRPSAASV